MEVAKYGLLAGNERKLTSSWIEAWAQVGGRIAAALGQKESESIGPARIMSENAAHLELKNKLLQFLRADVAGQQALRCVDIAFPCNDHLHFWPMPPWAAWVESERYRTMPNGVRYKPDVLILDDQDRPLAILEVTDRNRTNNCKRAADELNIPWFRFWAPPSEATQAELTIRVYPEDHIVWAGGNDGWRASADGWYDEDTGGVRYDTIYHSAVALGSINIGNILYANSTNLTCEWAAWYTTREDLYKGATRRRNRRNHIAQEIGYEILDEMETMSRNPQTFTAGIGHYQLHGNVGIYPLNPDPDTGEYRATDITTLLETWQKENLEMHRDREALHRHCRNTPPPFQRDSPRLVPKSP